MEQFPVGELLRMICLEDPAGLRLPADSGFFGRILIRHTMTDATDLTRAYRPRSDEPVYPQVAEPRRCLAECQHRQV